MRGAVRNRGRREDGKTNEVTDLHSFRGYAADVGSSFGSRTTAQQTHLKHSLRHTAETQRQFHLPRWQCWIAEWRLHLLTRKDLCLLDFSTSAVVECASICDGCCRVFDGRSWSRSKRAFSCPDAGQVARRRTMRDATQGVCCLIFTMSAQDVGALSV